MNREEARQRYIREMDNLKSDVLNEHERYAGRTFVSRGDFRAVGRDEERFRDRLNHIKDTVVREYLTLAPDRRSNVEYELNDLKGAIDDFWRAVQGVFVANPCEVIGQGVKTVPVYEEVEEVRYFPMATGGAFPVREKKHVQTGTKQVAYVVKRVG